MRKTLQLFCLGILLIPLQVLAQNSTVSGIILDGKEPVIGATILIKGTKLGTVTNFEGKFSLAVPSLPASLIVKSVGLKTQTIDVTSTSPLSVQMEKDVYGLKQVTVNAMGTKTDAKTVGYSSSQIGGEAINRSGESGVIQSLSGKASSVLVTRNSGDPGAGAYIQIRGQSTITGNLQPLIVVDGIPISNSSEGQTTDGVVQQSRLNDLNPDDIESTEILKGASAAAAWGTRAANGVIVITTKKGRKGAGGKNFSIDVNNTLALDYVNREFDKQGTFGQGSNGRFGANAGGSWGDKIASRGGADSLNLNGAKFVSADGRTYYPILKKGDKNVYNDANRDQVFRTGVTWNKSVSISSASEKNRIYFSMADWDQKGILNGLSDYRRTSGRLNYTNYLNSKLSLTMNSFISKISSNRIQQGSNLDGLYLGYLRTSPDFDNTDYVGTYYDAAGNATFNSHRGYRRYLGDVAPAYNNPGWTLNRQTNTSDVTRLTLTPEINYDFMPNSTLTARIGYDYSSDRRITYFPWRSGGSQANGSFDDRLLNESEMSVNIFDRTKFEINSDISINATVGYLYTDRQFHQLGGAASQFIIKDQDRFAFINSTSTNMSPFNTVNNRLNNRAYAIVDGNYKDKLFVQLTGASEASSTFQNRFFYPSANMAYEFTRDLKINEKVLSYGKIRGSIGKVGVEPPAYLWSTNYINSAPLAGWGEYMDGAQFGGAINRSTVQGNPNIKPEQKTEYEIGADLKFFNNKIGLNVSYYANRTTGAILQVDVPASTGFTQKWDNAATISNKGIEAELSYNVISNKDFNWTVFGNVSQNKNLVEELSGDIKSIFLAGFTGTSSRAVKGHALGTFWGGKFDRNEAGNLVLDANGFPTAATNEGVLGDPNPTWRGGIGSTASYKGLSMSLLIETSQGNQMWTGTYGVLNFFGINPETANEVTVSAADAATIKNANGQTISQLSYATQNADGSYTVRGNLKDFGAGNVLLDQAWYTGNGGGFGPISEQFIQDASWTRLREISLAYDIPSKFTKKIGIPRINVGVTGRNLILWTKVKGLDPELNLTGTSNGRGLDYFTNPGTKSYLFNVKFSF